MTRAFVLSGGGSLGAVQVGMLQALSERGVVPDLLVGTSAGAINAAFVAGHGAGSRALDDLAASWAGLRRSDLFPLDPIRHLRALSGRQPSLFSDQGLTRLISSHLMYRNLEEASIPVHVVATNVLSGEDVLLSRGDALSAVLASAAIPAVYPAVSREGLTLVDGGLANNTAISQAVALGANEIYVLPTGYACALPHPPTTPLATAVQALGFLTQQRLIRDVAHFADRVQIRLLPPLCPLEVFAVDFRHATNLIARAHAASAAWLEAGGTERQHPERFLSLHHHTADSRDHRGNS